MAGSGAIGNISGREKEKDNEKILLAVNADDITLDGVVKISGKNVELLNKTYRKLISIRTDGNTSTKEEIIL